MTKTQVSATNEPEETTQETEPDWKPTKQEAMEVVTAQRLSVEDLAAVKTFDEAMKLAAQAHGGLLDSVELGDGFSILEDKQKLVGVPFVIVEWEHGKNVTMGEKFVIVRLVTQANQKFIITDGSTGIMRQLETMPGNRRGGIFCREGLRASVYGLDVNGQPVTIGSAEQDGNKQATTYYIA